jgi:curved DNA-binding protein
MVTRRSGSGLAAAEVEWTSVSDSTFVDHYETLQLSPNASAEMIERVYRALAKRYHPDNGETGNVDRFTEVQTAFETLSNPIRRAAYDVKYDENRQITWKIFKQEKAGDHRAEDRRLFHGILSLLYIARRRDPQNGGLGGVSMEKMLGCPQEHLDFPIWYLKQRGLIERLESGYFAITADGVDKLGQDDLMLPSNRLLAESSLPGGSSADGVAPERPVLLQSGQPLT